MAREFMLLFRNEKVEDSEKPSAEQMLAVMKQWQGWIKGIAAAGKFGGTNRLLPEGRSVNSGKVVSDGPYMEVKEMVGGYVIVKADNMDEATEIAKSCPNLLYGGKVEIRAVMTIDADPASDHFLEEQQ